VEEENIQLADGEINAALNRDDDLGRLVTCAFSFSVAPFSEVFGNSALFSLTDKGGAH